MTAIAIITDADSCVPPELSIALDIQTAPPEPVFLLELETIPRLRTEAGEAEATDAVAAAKTAIEAGATEIVYFTAGDDYGSAPDLATALADLDTTIRIEPTEGALMGAGWQVIAAAEALRSGGSVDEAIEAARHVRSTVRVFVMLEHPELASAAGNAELGMARHRALVALRGPEVAIMSRPTKREEALALLRDRFAEEVSDPSRTHVAVQHAAAGPGAEALARWIERELSPARVLVAPVTRHAATRLGPRMLGVAWYEA